MAVSGNDFEGGTNGSVANTTSIASSGYGFRVVSTPTGGGKFTTDSAHGSLAVAVARASNTWCVDQNHTLSTSEISFSVFVRYKTALPNDNDYLFNLENSGGSIIRMLVDGSTHAPFLQLSGITVYTGGTALVVNTWYRVDVRIHANASTGFIFADFYTITGTSPLFTGAALTGRNTGSTNFTNLSVGAFGVNAVTVGTTDFDYPRFDATQSSSYLGPATPTRSSTVALTQASTLSASAAIVRTSSVAFTNQSILTVGSAIWGDWRHVWDDPAISWDDNTIISAVAFTNASIMSVLSTAGSSAHPTVVAFTNDSTLSVVAFAHSGDLALLIGVADLEWTTGDADVEWTSAPNPAT